MPLLPVILAKLTSTFGYDDNHQPITGGECPTSFLVDWSEAGQTGTFFLELYP
jgi:hypothetical protein